MSRPGPDSQTVITFWTNQVIPASPTTLVSPVITMNYTNRLRFLGNVVSFAGATSVNILVQSSTDQITWFDDQYTDYANGGPVTAGEYVSPVGSDWKSYATGGQTISIGVVGDVKYYRLSARATGGTAIINMKAVQSLL